MLKKMTAVIGAGAVGALMMVMPASARSCPWGTHTSLRYTAMGWTYVCVNDAWPPGT